MTMWKNQRGDVPVGCLIGFVVLVLVAIIAMNAIPEQLKYGEFEKRVDELADRANRREYTPKKIKSEILEKAKDLRFDLPEKNVEIEKSDRWIKIYVHFDQEFRFPGKVHIQEREIRLERPIF